MMVKMSEWKTWEEFQEAKDYVGDLKEWSR